MNYRFPPQAGHIPQTVLSFTEALPICNVSQVSEAGKKKKSFQDVCGNIYELINLTDLSVFVVLFFFLSAMQSLEHFSFMSSNSSEPEF